MSKSIHYFRFYRQSQDCATILEESESEEEEESADRRSTVDAIGVLIKLSPPKYYTLEVQGPSF